MTETLKTSTYLKTIAIDVDGVLNSYTSGWTGADDMPDAPNPGAMRFLKDLVEDGRFEVVIVSSRLNHPDGIDAVKVWLWNNIYLDLGERDPETLLKKIKFSVERPPATVTIDDRAITFLGEWPSLDRLAAFQPWNKKPHHLRPDPLTSVAAIDALMMRIGRLAKETACPAGTNTFDWIEEMAEIGHKAAMMASVTIERLSEDDLTRIRATPVRPDLETARLLQFAADRLVNVHGDSESVDFVRAMRKAVDRIALPMVVGTDDRPTVDCVPVLSVDDLPVPDDGPDDFDVRAAKGFDPDDTMEIDEHDDEEDTPVRTVAVIRTDLPAQWETTARRIVLDGVEHYLVDGIEMRGDDEEKVDGLAPGVGDVPERTARYAAARSKSVDEVLADPSIQKAVAA
jgi:hypothetical protein